MTQGRNRYRVVLRALAAALAATIALAVTPAMAHDFGGQTTGGTGPAAPPPLPPCSGLSCLFDIHFDWGIGNDKEPPCSKAGKPVSLYTGAESYEATDLIVRGAFPIVITRYYNSQSRLDTPLGYGWAFAHDRRLYEYPDDSVVLRYGCGSRERFVKSGGAYVTPVGGILASLVENPDGTFVLSYANGARDYYDLEGRLTAVQDPQGNRLEFTYDPAGQLPIQATAPYGGTVTTRSYRVTRIDERAVGGSLTGHYVTVAYEASSGRLSTITASDGRVITYVTERYTVQSTCNIYPCPCVEVANTPTSGNLRKVISPNSIAQTIYYYEWPQCSINGVSPDSDPTNDHLLRQIVDAESMNVDNYPITSKSTTIAYDSSGRVVSETVGKQQFTFEYLIPYSRTRVTRTVWDAADLNPYTAVVTYDFDPVGHPSKITDPLGNEYRYTYNAQKFLQRREVWQNTAGSLALLQATDYTYDAGGNILTESTTLDSAEIVTRSWTYDNNWIASEQVVSSAAPTKIFRTEYTFFRDGEGKPVNIEEIRERKDGGTFQTTTLGYDARSRLTSVTLPDGVKLVHTYTGERLTKTAFEVGGIEIPNQRRLFDHDARGNVTKIWDARNNLSEITYDILDQPVTITNPLGEKTIFTYEGHVLRKIETGGTSNPADLTRRTQLVYDNQLRLSRVQQADYSLSFMDMEVYTRDSDGNPLTVKDARNRTTAYTYDVLGRMATMTDPASKTTTYKYDAVDNLVSVKDALNREVVFEHDDLGRRIAVVEKGVTPNPRTEFSYDAAGNLTRIRDAEGRDTLYEFDALSRNTSITLPLGQQTQFFYDSRDRLDYLLTARGQKIDYDYETWGALKEEKQYPTAVATTPDRTISYGFDLDGNLTSVSDSGVQVGPTYTATFDALSRLYDLTVKYIPGGDKVLSHRYNRFGERSDLTLQDGSTLAYSFAYDQQGRLGGATFAGQTLTGAYFNPSAELSTLTGPSSFSRAFVYDTRGLIQTLTTAGSGGQLAQIALTYDDVMNVDTFTDNDGVHNYDVDGLDRLVQLTHPGGLGLPTTESFNYDGVGNREQPGNPSAYQYDNNHRVTASPGLTYTWDADGNVLTRSDGASFTHDARSRLTQYVNGATTANYLQDPFGLRIKKVVGAQTTWYLWDGDQLLAEYDGSGSRAVRYAYLPGEDSPAQFADANGAYWVHSDQLGTPRALISSAGAVVWRASYEAFGKAVVDADPDGNSIPITFNARLPGQYFDAESGLHYNNQRDYDPALGRYLQADPFGQLDDTNLYQYAYNNPAVYTDPTGEIIPVVVAYLRCVASCALQGAAIQAAQNAARDGSGGCIPIGDITKDCALSCLNPLNWLNPLKGVGSAAVAGIVKMSAKAAKKPSLNAYKKALKQVHSEVGKLPKGQPGKFGSPQAGDSRKGYRLDPAHPRAPAGSPDSKPHINWWDYTGGKRGAGGRSGTVPIED